MKKILIINGPNLNLLGNREIGVYGKESLSDIENECLEKCKLLEINCEFVQNNNEGEIINLIQSVEKNFDGLIINPAAYTHTSVAILDALRSVTKPKIEIHLSNIYTREEYEAVNGLICGFGAYSYILAIEAIKNMIYN